MGPVFVGRRVLLTAAAVLVAYVAVARASLELASIHISSSPVWPPAGLAIAALAILGLRYWPAILLGAIISNGWVSGHWPSSLIIGLGNTGEALIGGWLVQRLGNGHLLDRMQSVAVFVVSVAAAAMVSASAGVGSLLLFDLAPTGDAWGIGITWWLGNVGGSLLVVPALLLVAQRGLHRDDAMGFVFGFASALAAFATTGTTLLLLLPAAFLPLVHRQGNSVAAALLGIGTGSVAMTLLGHGPFWGRDSNEALLLLQVFLLVFVTSIWVLAAGRRTRQTQASWPVAVSSISLAMAPLLIGAALIGLTLHPALVDLEEHRQLEQRAEVVNAWANMVAEQGAQLGALRGLFEASDMVTQDDFRHFIEAAEWEFGPGHATAVGYAPLLAHADVPAFEQRIRNDTSLPTAVAENFSVFPPTNNSFHAPVEYVYPMDPSPGAIGFDLLLDSARKVALEESRMLRAPVASAPVEIIRPEGNEIGFMIALPVYVDSEVRGFVVSAQVAPARGDSPAPASEAVYRVMDINGNETLLFASGSGEWAASETIAAWHREWRLDFAPMSLSTAPEKAAAWFVLSATGILSIAVGLVVYAYDTTRDRAMGLSRKMVEQAKVDAQRKAEIDRLESLDAFRSQFLNMVAHELRTPLTPIRTQAHVLRKHAESPQAQRSLDILGRGIARLAAVVDDLLVAAKANAGELALSRQDVDLGSIARDAAEAHADSAQQLGTTLTIDTEPIETRGDPVRLAQIIDNLLTNALKFAPGGRVEVIARKRGSEAHVIVRDNGVGIDPDSLNHLGQPFSQAEHGRIQADKGTGLGLYICKTLARLHGGRLELRSAGVGQGTEARLILPRPEG